MELSQKDIMRLVNRYIGVSDGYLGDFTYRTHEDFYPEYCDLDVDAFRVEGTTRERFIEILKTEPPANQAKIIRGTMERFPVSDGGPSTRTQALHDQLCELADRLEAGGAIQGSIPAITSDVVSRAIDDAETLLRSSGAASGVDRVHTALHGYLLAVCDRQGIAYSTHPKMTELFKLLRQHHPALQNLGPRPQDVERVLNNCVSILTS